MKTTLNEIRSYFPCPDRLRHGLQHADPRPTDDEPFPVSRVLDVNGLSDTLWLLGRKGEQQLLARFACGCAERVVGPYWAPEYPSDRRPQRAIAAARRWVDDPTEKNRLKADDATEAVKDARTDAAAYAAAAAAAAAKAARAAVEDAAEAAAAAALAARIAVAEDAAEEREWQIGHLRKLLGDA